MIYTNVMRRSVFVSALVLFCAVAVSIIKPDPVSASELEEPQARQGYYVSAAAVGLLNLNNEKSHGISGPWPGVGSELRMGEAIFSWLDVGIGLGLNWSFDDSYRLMLGHLSMEGQLRPIEPLFIRLGMGFGFTQVTSLKSDARSINGRVGGAYTVAVGYDFFLCRKVDDRKSGGIAISPYAAIQFGPSNSTSSHMSMIGISFTWWSGLEENQLKLTVEEAYGGASEQKPDK